MSEGRKTLPLRETGTVPKARYLKNTPIMQEIHVSNNLQASSSVTNEDRGPLNCEARNQSACSNYQCFEGSFINDYKIYPNCINTQHINMSGSSRNSPTYMKQLSGNIRKCDNFTKYPDKQHIEDKLNQIREYVNVTNSLMSNVKADQLNHDELYQMLTALRDSEKKLEHMLMNQERNNEFENNAVLSNHEDLNRIGSSQESQENPIFNLFQNNVTQQNEIGNKLLISEKKLQALHEHQSILLQLQEKAENHMKDARKAQEKLAAHVNSCPYSISPVTNEISQQEMKRENNKSFDSPDSRDIDLPDNIEGNGLENDEREQMLRLLDSRDSDLCMEQIALQQKLQDLNTKKQQIDHLVTQLHNYSVKEEGTDEMAKQIKQIVEMKEQLATLKEMLSMVKATEADLCIQNSIKPGNVIKDESVGKAESINNDRRWDCSSKQSNKSSICSSREQLQAELQAKKQELEEFMYKDQDHTTTINRDVCNEILMGKGQPAFSVESVPSSWTLLQDSAPLQESCISKENGYSSDEEEIQNYTQINNIDSNKTADYDTRNFQKQFPCGSVQNFNTIAQETPSSTSVNHQWSGVDQKQVELLSNLCQSLLEQQQNMSNQIAAPNFQWFANYIQTQQSLMLSTISQCCQLMWLQQQDINTLINTVAMLQQQMPKSYQSVKIPTRSVDTVSSACSLPNLSGQIGSRNAQYAMLRREQINCSSPRHGNNRNSAIPIIDQPTQQIWHGNQALNNQVAPGNRANNYWDNFRSYSRQNLLSTSTKSNEGSQNSPSTLERNIENSLSQGRPIRPQSSASLKMNLTCSNPPVEHKNYIQPQIHLQFQSTQQNAINKSSKRNKAQCRNRNEWNKDIPQAENLSQKSKLFDMLRENVYKEVTLLISANENRPHFLIQLFRDLQLISSDPLRRSALQSIQSLITQSVGDSNNIKLDIPFQSVENEQYIKIEPPKHEQIKIPQNMSKYCYPQPSATVNTVGDEKMDLDARNVLIGLLPFLKSHNEDIIHPGLIDWIKMMIFQLLPVKHFENDTEAHAKLDAILSENLTKYQGRRINDIKEDFLKTIADILISFFQEKILRKDHLLPNTGTPCKKEEKLPNPILFLPTNAEHILPFEYMNLSNIQSVSNGDLAEADQTTRETENEEGAVGGIILPTSDGQNVQTNNCDVCF